MELRNAKFCTKNKLMFGIICIVLVAMSSIYFISLRVKEENNSEVNFDPRNDSPLVKGSGYMIYYCETYCGGWGDWLKGILVTYVISMLTNRTFGIQIRSLPCNLTDFLQPNHVTWNFPVETNRSHPSVQVVNRLDSLDFYHKISSANFDQVFTKDVVLFTANLEYFDLLMQNKRYKEQLKWMENLSRGEVVSRLFWKLFKFSPSVKASLEMALHRAHPTPEGKLLCGHLRMAGNAEDFRDTEKRYNSADGIKMLEFLQNYPILTNKPSANDTRYFVTSDSRAFVQKAETLFGDRFVKTEGEFIHIGMTDDKEAACDGFTKVIVDQQLFSHCDVLVIGKSGYARQAAYLRRKTEGLFCMRLNGDIVSCSPDTLREMYNIPG